MRFTIEEIIGRVPESVRVGSRNRNIINFLGYNYSGVYHRKSICLSVCQSLSLSLCDDERYA